MSSSISATALTLNGDDGTSITLKAPPQRMISLAPNITELIYAAGLGSRLVAVTAYSNYPKAAEQLPRVGDAFRLDWERLLTYKPDLVIAWQSSLAARDRATFARLGIPVLVLEPRRLQDIPRSLRLLGQIDSTAATIADAAARTFEQHSEALRAQYAQRPKVRVWFQIATEPLLTINHEHVINDVLELCGAHNVFADAPLLTPAVSAEAIVRAQPQLLLGSADTASHQQGMQQQWQKLPLAAVKAQHMVFIPPDLISRASPRILQGAEKVCQAVEQVRSAR